MKKLMSHLDNTNIRVKEGHLLSEYFRVVSQFYGECNVHDFIQDVALHHVDTLTKLCLSLRRKHQWLNILMPIVTSLWHFG